MGVEVVGGGESGWGEGGEILPPSLLGLTVVTKRTVGVVALASNLIRKLSAAWSHR